MANATTELHFEQIMRENQGSYRVEVENTAEVIQPDMRTAVLTFNVDVQGMFKGSMDRGVAAITVFR